MKDFLDPLLTYLATTPAAGPWQEWQIERVVGGSNNLIYHATCATADLAVKLTRRDARDRAGREYNALSALQQLGYDLAPRPILLGREYAYPIIVQEWLDGEASQRLPATPTEWDALLHYYATLHQITPERYTGPIPAAVTNIASVAQGLAMIQAQLALLPAEARLADLLVLVDKTEQLAPAEPTGHHIALCRVDANLNNFIRRPHGWASVDWENSGWGEATFELVDLMTHPSCRAVTLSEWAILVRRYAELSGDQHTIQKVAAFYPLMLTWWVVRTARLIYELPRGLDPRIGGVTWASSLPSQYQYYYTMADTILTAKADWIA